jgi:hypothetical protein
VLYEDQQREIFFQVASPARLVHVGSILSGGAGLRNAGALSYHDFAFPGAEALLDSDPL